MVAPLYRHGQNLESVLSKTIDGQKKPINYGLWFNRFFDGYSINFESLESDNKKREWIETLADGKTNKTLEKHLQELATRQLAFLQNMPNEYHAYYQSNGSFATGLGCDHPVENGFTFHPTHGAPYLCGASIKGLVRSYFEEWHSFQPNENKADKLKLWFGTTDKKDVSTHAGAFIFFDAITIQFQFALEIMTPHMGDWYANGDSITGLNAQNASKLPGDWHSPVPIPFLAVKDTLLLISCCLRAGVTKNIDEKYSKITDEDFNSMLLNDFETIKKGLTEALSYLGAGAKTATGLGRFDVISSENYSNFDVIKEIEKNFGKQEEQKRVSNLSNEDKILDDVLKLKADEKALAEALGKNYNKTNDVYKENWDLFIAHVKRECGDLILSWANEDKKSNKRKTHDKLYKNT